MKILAICQHYWPEPYPLTDILEGLVERGHQVDLVTDIPNYPMGYIYDDYKSKKNRDEIHNGVHIHRTFTIGRRNNVLFRMLNYYSYANSSSEYVKKLSNDYDVVFTNQTSPIMMTSAAFVYAKKHKKNVVMYCMDLWPACLAAGGLSSDSTLYKHYGKVSKKLYGMANRILITSSMFKQYLIEQDDIESNRIQYLPQYAMSQFDVKSCYKKPNGTIDLMFAGNIGAAQSMSTIIEAANRLKQYKQLCWHIVGDGSELENTKALVNQLGLNNVIFYGRKPVEEMPKLYAMADAMLVTLTSDSFISLTLPGKVQTYMAAGKPIIASADGEIPKVINDAQCGYCAKAEDSVDLATMVEKFINHEDKEQLGKNASQYYSKHFTRNQFLNSLENELKKFANR